MTDEPASQALREQVARIIAQPGWFDVTDGRCILDNYPEQHLKMQADAYAKADRVLALVGSLAGDTEKKD